MSNVGEDFICCLCGRIITGSWGNNPWPLSHDIEERCCDVCNATQVIPARLAIIAESRKKKEK